MRQKQSGRASSSEQIIRDIKRKTRKQYSAEVQIEYSRFKGYAGDHETSIAAARKVLDQDPVSVFANHLMGYVLYFARQYESRDCL